MDEVDIQVPDKTQTARRQLDSIFLFAVGASFYCFSSFGLVRVRWAAYQLWNHDWPTVWGLSRRNTDGRRCEEREHC